MDYILLKDYPYEVHTDGTVYRLERKSKNGRRNLKRLQICPHKATNGYMVVRLFCPQEGRYKNIYLHRLLYSCFVGDIIGLEIDHLTTRTPTKRTMTYATSVPYHISLTAITLIALNVTRKLMPCPQANSTGTR